ncbi:hypothetical protein BC941DRAFT_519205 [Chlamydoabsidia padenii]|nr:hypothetical protein BC941DRAFT_519205 [Chlamydoabsidia padenii]
MLPDTTASQLYLVQQDIQNCKDEQAQEHLKQAQIYRRVNKALMRHTDPLLPTTTTTTNDPSLPMPCRHLQQQLEQKIKQAQKLAQILDLQVTDREARLTEHINDDQVDLESLIKEEAELKQELARYDDQVKELEQQVMKQQQQQQQQQT